jgi:protein phosphatase
MSPTESSRLLINLANCRGGSDNSTVIVIGIESYPATESAGTDPAEDVAAKIRTSEMRSLRTTKLWRGVLIAASILCLLAGLGLAAMRNIPASSVLLVAAVLAWLIHLRLSNTSRGRFLDPASTGQEEIDPLPQLQAPESSTALATSRRTNGFDSVGLSRSAFLPTSPYRIIEAELSESLLTNLAEFQSELVHAAKDSGWKVDFEELTNLNRQAVQAQQAQKLDRAIKSRAKAIDLLMKEMYQRSRSI